MGRSMSLPRGRISTDRSVFSNQKITLAFVSHPLLFSLLSVIPPSPLLFPLLLSCLQGALFSSDKAARSHYHAFLSCQLFPMNKYIYGFQYKIQLRKEYQQRKSCDKRGKAISIFSNALFILGPFFKCQIGSRHNSQQ